MTTVIHFQHVSKRYYIGIGGGSLRNALEGLSALLTGKRPPPRHELWALQNVSFQVKQGESLGLLGHNGAGKTTVLKLLSQITQPTSGAIQVHGRLGSLIELGAGFHPEMTGRENVYLNGVILGMTRKEIAQRFDSIVDFSGVEEFIDTPVKRYSSGMYVRLAFSVAAHIDPAILLVDEVLAVGDINFRAKCYRRMAELRRSGTTVVLVSHQVEAIRDTCDRALLLWKGGLLEDGSPDLVIKQYLSKMQLTDPDQQDILHLASNRAGAEITRPATGGKILQVAFVNGQGVHVKQLPGGQSLEVRVECELEQVYERPIVRVDFYHQGTLYTGFSTAYDEVEASLGKGKWQINLLIDRLDVPEGVYLLSVVLADRYEYNLLDTHHMAYVLQVLRSEKTRGHVSLKHQWDFQQR